MRKDSMLARSLPRCSGFIIQEEKEEGWMDGEKESSVHRLNRGSCAILVLSGTASRSSALVKRTEKGNRN